MRWRDIGEQTCSVARALSVVGDRWTLLVLREAFLRTRRFEDFLERTGAARNVLAARLEKLVEHGVLERRPYQERPTRYEYRLTEKGLDLYPVMMALVRWGDRWLDDGRGRPIEHRHKSCGHVMHMEPACSECGDRLDPRAVEVTLGPALRSDPEALRRFRTTLPPSGGDEPSRRSRG
jgi:DNA-binding HxlR family transcriptional regulator